MTRSLPSGSSCVSTAPVPKSEASVVRMNDFEKSGSARTGFRVIFDFKSSNASWCSSVQRNMESFKVSLLNGLAIFE